MTFWASASKLGATLALSILMGGFLIPAATGAASTQVALGSIVNLSKDTGVSADPIVGSIGTHVYVAWDDNTNGHSQVYFVTSSDSGKTWSPTIQFTGSGSSANPQMAATGSSVFLTWKQGGVTAFSRSSNFGATFSPVITFPIASGMVSGQVIATNGTSVYLAWVWVAANGSSYVMFTASHKGGSFSTPIQHHSISSTTGLPSGHEPQIAAQGNYVYLVWASIWFTRSADGGHTFSTQVNVRNPACVYPCLSREPMITVSDANVYITWPSNLGGAYQAYIAVSHDRGTTWVTKVIASTADVTSVREVQVAACAGSNVPVSCGGSTNVYVTVRAKPAGGGPVNQFMVVSHDSGNTFTKPFDLAVQSHGQLGFGGIAVDGMNVYVEWPHAAQPSGIVQMWLQSSLDQGSTWQGVQQVSASTGGVIGMEDSNSFHDQGPMVSASLGMVFSVWQDNSAGNGDVYFVAGTA